MVHIKKNAKQKNKELVWNDCEAAAFISAEFSIQLQKLKNGEKLPAHLQKERRA